MSKQEEIREGIEDLVAKKFSKLMPDRFRNDWLSLNGEGLTRQILDYLHSQGVVIKVEGELPELPKTAHEAAVKIYNKAIDDMLKAGCVKTEPLIEVPVTTRKKTITSSTNKTVVN